MDNKKVKRKIISEIISVIEDNKTERVRGEERLLVPTGYSRETVRAGDV